MIRPHIVLGVLACSILLFSCSPEHSSTGPTAAPDIWGKLSAIKESRKVINGADTVFTSYEMAMSQFLGDPKQPSVFIDGGDVTVNTISLNRDAMNFYMRRVSSDSTPQNLGLDLAIDWHVTGANTVPAFSYADVPVYPEYTGAFPAVINKSLGLDLVFDSTTVINADSVRVYINDPFGNTVSQTFASRAGAVTVSPATLAPLTAVSDHSAYIAIMPYAGIIKVFRNKGYFFARERRMYQSVSIAN